MLLLGERGSGKSTILAKCIQKYLVKEQKWPAQYSSHATMAIELSNSPTPARHARKKGHDMQLLDMDDISSTDSMMQQDLGHEGSLLQESSSWLVFYHFVGFIPHSSELGHILQRVWSIQGLGEPRTTTHASVEVNSLAKDVLQLLSRRGQQKVVLFIDGIDRVSIVLGG